MEESQLTEKLTALFWKLLVSEREDKAKIAEEIESFCTNLGEVPKSMEDIVDFCMRMHEYGKTSEKDRKILKEAKAVYDNLRILDEKNIAVQLSEMLHEFLKAKDEKRTDTAREIHDFCSGVMDRPYYIHFDGDFKYILDQCLLLKNWVENGVYYQRERVMSARTVSDMIEKLEEISGRKIKRHAYPASK